MLLERCIALLGPALTRPGAVVVDATLGLGGHSELLLQRFPQVRLVGLDRDEQALAGSEARLQEYADRTTLVHAVYDRMPEVLAELGLPARRRGPVRPRGVQPAARRGRARLLLPPGRAAGHAHGPHPGPHRRRRAQHLPGRRAGAHPARPTARSGSPGASPAPSCGRASSSRSPRAPGSSTWCATRSRRRPGVPVATPPSARSRRCGSRSTPSSRSCAGRCPPPSTRSVSAGGSWCSAYHSLEDQITKSVAGVVRDEHGPARPAVRARGPGARAAAADAGGRDGLGRAGRGEPARPRRCGCARPSGRGPHERAVGPDGGPVPGTARPAAATSAAYRGRRRRSRATASSSESRQRSSSRGWRHCCC